MTDKNTRGVSLGSRVMVSFDPDDTTNDPAKQYDGMEFTVSGVRYMGTRGKYGKYYFLYGCESDYGIPYVFSKDNLILLK